VGMKKTAKNIWRRILKPLKCIRDVAKKTWNKIPRIVRTPIFVFIFALPTWLTLAFLIRKFLSGFGEGLLVETFGMLLDVLVIGIIILWLSEIRDKRYRRELEIERYKDEIDDYRGWDEKEATFRIVGNIRRLNRKGITEIDLSFCYLKEARLSKANLKKANLMGAKLQEADLQRANLQMAFLWTAKLQGAWLWETNLERADLSNANLEGANLSNANLQGTNFLEANLLGVMNINLQQISKVKTLYRAKLDRDLEKKIKEKYPHLFNKPDWWEEK